MSSKSRFSATLAAGFAMWSAMADTSEAGDYKPDIWRKWEAWAELGGHGSNRSFAQRGEVTLWSPLAQNQRSLFFADIRGKLFADEQLEGNIAVGYRLLGPEGWNPGFWIGFDRRHTELGSEFNQISVGFEALSANFDMRINGYVPIEDTNRVDVAVGTIPAEGTATGGNVVLARGGPGNIELRELALWGFDAEIGLRVPLERFSGINRWEARQKDIGMAPRYHDLRLYFGAYYFAHEDLETEMAGPRLRAEWRIENIVSSIEGSRLTFDASYQHDELRDHVYEGGVRLRIPLNGSVPGTRLALSPQEMRMSEGIKRDTDIVTSSVVSVSGGRPDKSGDLPVPLSADANLSDLEAGFLESLIAGDNPF